MHRSAKEHYEEIFWISAPKNLGPKNYLFLTTLQLSGNFEGQYLRQGTWCRQSGNGVGNAVSWLSVSNNYDVCHCVIVKCNTPSVKRLRLIVNVLYVVWRHQCGMHSVRRCCQGCLPALLSWTCNCITGQSFHWQHGWILSEVRCC